MCGICGTIGIDAPAAAERIRAALRHRGPDDEGLMNDAQRGLALAVSRLSIIDIEGGHQPLANEDGSVWVALNGEIYNHAALRERLRRHGHRFATDTDTEVLVHLYEEFGPSLVHAVDGMFAFAIWDRRRSRLLLARDRFGEKPLFYWRRGRRFAFASELRALLAGVPTRAELDPAAVDAFFVFGYVPPSSSIVGGIEQLPPGHWLIREGSSTRVERYWEPPRPSPGSFAAAREARLEAEKVLVESVKSRLVADVPVGVLLSGGVDSALIAAIATEAREGAVRTFTIGYMAGAVNETEKARAVAARLATDHHELILDAETVRRLATKVLADIDQPLADPALIPTYAIARSARRDVKVLVGGEGADEVFGGYPRYRWLQRAHLLERRLPDRSRRWLAAAIERAATGRAERLVDVVAPVSALERHVDWVTAGRRRLRSQLYGPLLKPNIGLDGLALQVDGWDGDLSPAASSMALDRIHWLPGDVLAKADRASMRASLELRTPYLHPRLAELSASVPLEEHLRLGGKRWLREMLRSRLPPAFAMRRKTAFRVPVGEWLRGPLRELMESSLCEGPLATGDWLAREPLKDLARSHLSGADHADVLWPAVCLGAWLAATAE